MRRMKSREPGCPTTPRLPRLEMFMANSDGFLTSLWSRARTMTSCTLHTESSSMVLATITTNSTTRLWQTLSFSDKMLLRGLLPANLFPSLEAARFSNQWAPPGRASTNLSSRWLAALLTPRPSFCSQKRATGTESNRRSWTVLRSPTRIWFHSSDSQMSPSHPSPRSSLALLELLDLKSLEVPLSSQTRWEQPQQTEWDRLARPRKQCARENKAGTATWSPSQNTTSRSTDPWECPSRLFEIKTIK